MYLLSTALVCRCSFPPPNNKFQNYGVFGSLLKFYKYISWEFSFSNQQAYAFYISTHVSLLYSLDTSMGSPLYKISRGRIFDIIKQKAASSFHNIPLHSLQTFAAPSPSFLPSPQSFLPPSLSTLL